MISILELTTTLKDIRNLSKATLDPTIILLEELYNFADLFDKEKANDLPPY